MTVWWKGPDLSQRRSGSGGALELDGLGPVEIDGFDIRDVYDRFKPFADECRDLQRPGFVDLKTYRYIGHSMSDPAKYRTREEVEKIKTEKDCIEHVRDLLTQGGLASDEELKAIDKDIKAIVNESAEFAKESPEPDLSELWTDITV